MPLVERIASKLRTKLPDQAEVDELVSAGHVGLVDAARKFDPARGVQFGAFARRRILGAMLDHLRRLDELTRHQREQVRAGTMPFFLLQLHVDDDAFAHRAGLDKLEAPRTHGTETLQQRFLSEHIEREMARLTQRERYILTEYFWHDRTLGEIVQVLGISESRASQIKDRALVRLKRWLMS